MRSQSQTSWTATWTIVKGGCALALLLTLLALFVAILAPFVLGLFAILSLLIMALVVARLAEQSGESLASYVRRFIGPNATSGSNERPSSECLSPSPCHENGGLPRKRPRG